MISIFLGTWEDFLITSSVVKDPPQLLQTLTRVMMLVRLFVSMTLVSPPQKGQFMITSSALFWEGDAPSECDRFSSSIRLSARVQDLPGKREVR